MEGVWSVRGEEEDIEREREMRGREEIGSLFQNDIVTESVTTQLLIGSPSRTKMQFKKNTRVGMQPNPMGPLSLNPKPQVGASSSN